MSQTKKMNQFFKVIAIVFCILNASICFSLAGEGDVSIRFDGRKMSADISDVILKDVLEEINALRKFVVKGDDSVLSSGVSVNFENLSFEDGLKKILGHTNHILYFNKDNEPTGVLIVGAGSGISPRKTRPDKKRIKATPNNTKNNTPMIPGKKYEGPTPASDMVAPTKEELARMKVIYNAPTPGGPVEVTDEDLKNLKVVKNSAPPGGAVKATPEELERMNPASDSPSMPTPDVN